MRVEYRYPADDKWYRGVLALIPAEGGEVNMLYVDENAMEVINLDADDLDDVRARLRALGSGEIVWEAKHDKLAKKKAGKEGGRRSTRSGRPRATSGWARACASRRATARR